MKTSFVVLTVVLLVFAGCLPRNKQATSADVKKLEDLKNEIETASGTDSLLLIDSLFSSIAQFEHMTLPTDVEADFYAFERMLLETWDAVPEARQLAPALGDTLRRRRFCFTTDTAPATALRVPRYRNFTPDFLLRQAYEIPIAFHIVSDDEGRYGIPEDVHSVLQAALDSLNVAFQDANTNFVLHSVDTTRNTDWYHYGAFLADPVVAAEMTTALSINPDRVLNLYTIGGPNNFLGEATFPWWDRTRGQPDDAVIVWYDSMPGGGVVDYSEGNTLVHEVGHYLGLYHTFHAGEDNYTICQASSYNGCSIGDLINDTPAQRFCHYFGCGQCLNNLGCACQSEGVTCDTCPDSIGVDPVQNYMGYNPDPCMREFTPEQMIRVQQMLYKYRRVFALPV